MPVGRLILFELFEGDQLIQISHLDYWYDDSSALVNQIRRLHETIDRIRDSESARRKSVI